METTKRYCVYIFWDYTLEEPLDVCEIFPSSVEYEQYDGNNFISGTGRDGFEFNIYNTLEEAVVQSHFNPEHIQYSDLTELELLEIDNVLQRYKWDNTKGLVKK